MKKLLSLLAVGLFCTVPGTCLSNTLINNETVNNKLKDNQTISWKLNFKLVKKQESSVFCSAAVVQSIIAYLRPNAPIISQDELAAEMRTDPVSGTTLANVQRTLVFQLGNPFQYNRTYLYSQDSLTEPNYLARTIWTIFENLMSGIPIFLHVSGRIPQTSYRTEGHAMVIYGINGTLNSPETTEIYVQDPYNLQSRRFYGSQLRSLANNTKFPFLSLICHQI